MTACETPPKRLDPAIALATRLLSAGHIDLPLAGWFRKPSAVGGCAADTLMVAAAMEEIVGSVSKNVEPYERSQWKHASGWIARALQQLCCVGDGQPKWCEPEFAQRLGLAAMLPLYRSLASSSLVTCFAETRNRLCEALVLRGLRLELDDEFEELLAGALRGRGTPNAIAAEYLEVEVGTIAAIAMDCSENQSSGKFTYSQEHKSWLSGIDPSDFNVTHEEWADPELLWRLAGELLSDKSNMLMPRSWVETPVSWNQISENWAKIQRLLQLQSTLQTEDVGDSDENSTQPTAGSSAAEASSTGASESSIRHLEDTEQLIESTEDLASDANYNRSRSQPAKPDTSPEPAELVTTNRIPIAEVRSHNDPIFVSALQRTIIMCRSEGRTLSSATIVVTPENPQDQVDCCRRCDDGLVLWQRKLVEWLSDYPDLEDVACFVTPDGEMMVTIVDHDRTDTTHILRQGLMEVLTGESFDDSSSLARVELPVRFHAGIATVIRPGAAFGAEQMLEPLRRCLSAATRLGSASIKSIEVY